MSIAMKSPPAPRYGSAAQVAAYSGLSAKTVRRLVGAGSVRGLKVGRRLLIPYDDFDRHLARCGGRPGNGRTHAMAVAPTPPGSAHTPYVPRLTPEELDRSNRELAGLLDAWEADGDEQEQRETLDVLTAALGRDRVASSRKLFP